MTITSIDFETANYADSSIIATGVAVFEDGKLTESLYWLIRPPKGSGWFREDFTENCQGLTWFDVRNKPEFRAVAPELFARLAAADVVIAHNAEFDIRILRGTAGHFGLQCPEFEYLCTWRLSQKVWPDLPAHGLDAVAAHNGHEFQHHHAQADAEAAGRVMVRMMEHAGVKTARELAQATGVSLGQV